MSSTTLHPSSMCIDLMSMHAQYPLCLFASCCCLTICCYWTHTGARPVCASTLMLLISACCNLLFPTPAITPEHVCTSILHC